MIRRLCLLLTFASAAGCYAGESPRPPLPPPAAAVADPAALRAYLTRIESELRDNILPFWLQHAPDREHGGFVGEISDDLVVKPDAPRGALLSARILWTYSTAYGRYQDPAHLEMARRAYDDLLNRFWDREDGGLLWSITADGQPLVTRKVLYVQAFGIYGLSEFHRATGDQGALDRAIALYRAIEAHCHDHEHGGYYEEFTRDWKLEKGMRRSVMGSLALKSQNAHLHLLEAYTNLLQVWPDPELRRNLRELVEVMLTRIINPANHHLWLFLAADWTPRSDRISFGHDIEASWLLVEAATVLDDPALTARIRTIALQMAQATLAEGVDTDGGLFSEADPKGLTDATKEWWQQAEAATGFLNAFQTSGDPRFLQASLHSWDFIATHLVDRKHGEWFRAVKRDGTVWTQAKVSFWKCPYHNGRACLEMIDRLHSVLRPEHAD
jgi:mannobiose 2-epimerase